MIDKVTIRVSSGDGGSGSVSFHREKFVPRGGPDGGDGGKGGDVIILADSNLSQLSNFKYRKIFRAEDGARGQKNNKTGKNGADLVLTVPPGTVVREKTVSFDNISITDLNENGESVIVASGGSGGKGNARFVSSTNQVPRLAQKGEPGEEKEVTLELRLIADAGIIGYPNVGKSSLLAAASAARPRIADYPFTTLEPVLGLVEAGRSSFILAEIPGLIPGASMGKGLGHEFLRHVVRTRVLVHLVDGTSGSPVDDMLAVNNELFLFDSSLAGRPQVVAVNKIDIPEVRERIAGIKAKFRDAGVTVIPVSASTGEGLRELVAKVAGLLEKTPVPDALYDREVPQVIVPRPKPGDVAIEKIGAVYVLKGQELERLVAGSNTADVEVRRQLGAIITGPRIRPRLEKMGISPGDNVRIGNFEWTW
jgi:GTP-binding protein